MCGYMHAAAPSERAAFSCDLQRARTAAVVQCMQIQLFLQQRWWCGVHRCISYSARHTGSRRFWVGPGFSRCSIPMGISGMALHLEYAAHSAR